MFAPRWPIWIAALGSLGALGCVPKSYQYGRFHHATDAPVEMEVERGEPDPAPESDKPFFPRFHGKRQFELDWATAERVEDYLHNNELHDLRIEINYHNTSGQWRRLRENTRISPLWRYTAGSMSVIGYSLFPSNFWAVNRYNPYTDTLSINTNDSIELLHESAMAKTIRTKRWPGPYILATSLPGVSMIREADAANEVIGYARAENEWETEKEAYRTLYPRVGRAGVRVVGPVLSLVLGTPGVSMLVNAGGWALGRGVGYVYEKRREAEVKDEAKTEPLEKGS